MFPVYFQDMGEWLMRIALLGWAPEPGKNKETISRDGPCGNCTGSGNGFTSPRPSYFNDTPLEQTRRGRD